MMTLKNIHNIFIPPKLFIFLKTPKTLKIKISNPLKMARAYVCMKISENPPPPWGYVTSPAPSLSGWLFQRYTSRRVGLCLEGTMLASIKTILRSPKPGIGVHLSVGYKDVQNTVLTCKKVHHLLLMWIG